jgi:hypothetical protein
LGASLRQSLMSQGVTTTLALFVGCQNGRLLITRLIPGLACVDELNRLLCLSAGGAWHTETGPADAVSLKVLPQIYGEDVMTVRRKPFVIVQVLLIVATAAAAGGESPGEPRSDRSDEFKAVLFSDSEDVATRQLNDLAAQGWRYVGPLANGLIAFRREDALISDASPLQGDWEYLSYEKDGVVTEYKPAQRMTLSIVGNRWSVGPSPGPGPSHRVEISGRELVFHGVVTAGAPVVGETPPLRTLAWGLYELQGDSLVYCMTSNVPESSVSPDMGRCPIEKPRSFETAGTANTLYRLRRSRTDTRR